MTEQTDRVYERLVEGLRNKMNSLERVKSMTEAELAEATGYSEKYVSRVLAGKVAATTRVWTNLLAATEIPPIPADTECAHCGRPLRAHVGIEGQECLSHGVMVNMDTGAEVASWGTSRPTTFLRADRTTS
ncbi:helix-turn-helix domain-containing protein [Nocardia sp. SC052]|uniref:helix-turn-helix domain-containing protein n=1 Tax=Nocardia sichangensis TaxID=3385975 RepID=UPI0039A3DFD4